MSAGVVKDQKRLFHATIHVTRLEEWCVEATSPEEARMLHIEPNAPLMQIERTAYTAAGLAVEYARDLFRPDRVRISLRTGISV